MTSKKIRNCGASMLKRGIAAAFVALALMAQPAIAATTVFLTTPGTPTSALTGSISVNTLTTTAITFNNGLTTPPIGMFVSGVGVTANSYITGACSGSAPNFTCPLSQSSSVGSIAMTTLYGWLVPATNTISLAETIGGGASGGIGYQGGAHGGGGGAYSAQINITVANGTYVPYQVGSGGAANVNSGAGTTGGDTWFNGASLAASSVGAKGGVAGGTGKGGQASAGIGTTKYSGGDGAGTSGGATAGGGGAAGPNGAGANSTAPQPFSNRGGTGGGGADNGFNAAPDTGNTSGSTGGNNATNTGGGVGGAHNASGSDGAPGAGGGGAGANSIASSSLKGGDGGAGIEWDATHGSGGGGGGAGDNDATPITQNGGAGGLYGGGGGMGDRFALTDSATSGPGGQGIIRLTYDLGLPSTARHRLINNFLPANDLGAANDDDVATPRRRNARLP